MNIEIDLKIALREIDVHVTGACEVNQYDDSFDYSYGSINATHEVFSYDVDQTGCIVSYSLPYVPTLEDLRQIERAIDENAILTFEEKCKNDFDPEN